MYTVLIKFDTQEKAETFMSWLDNQAEQDYWQTGEMRDELDKYVRHFEYDYRRRVIDTSGTLADKEE